MVLAGLMLFSARGHGLREGTEGLFTYVAVDSIKTAAGATFDLVEIMMECQAADRKGVAALDQ